MKVYAVRQKSTGFFIPKLPVGKRRGGSYSEPTKGCSPRLFHNEHAAKAFIGNWLQGTFANHVDYEGEGDLIITKQPHRKKEDMEVVPFTCVEDKGENTVLTALQRLYDLIDRASSDAFDNGVTHQGMDEGNVLAGRDISLAKQFLPRTWAVVPSLPG